MHVMDHLLSHSAQNIPVANREVTECPLVENYETSRINL